MRGLCRQESGEADGPPRCRSASALSPLGWGTKAVEHFGLPAIPIRLDFVPASPSLVSTRSRDVLVTFFENLIKDIDYLRAER